MPTEAPEPRAPSSERLPASVTPTAYRIELAPDLDEGRFDGRVEIDVLVTESTDRLVLHAVDLDLRDVTVEAGGSVQPASVEPGPGTEQVAVVVPAELHGTACLRAAFSGSMGRLCGLYRSTFLDAGTERTIVSTQLCMTDARRAFPCFDEPAMKATFELTAIVPPGNVVVSNTKVVRERTCGDGRIEVRFAPTIPMSSYLVALVVGPLERTEVLDVDGVALSVLTTPGHARLAGQALETAEFALRFYADYFGRPYPGDKLDLVGVPDFAYGAMENLGCVTFRDTALLVDPATGSSEQRQRVANVVAHELAHMWFGDLVTFEWWEGAWLNEAFATFMAFVCVDAHRPDWETWLRFLEQRELGLSVDELHSTRPIEFPVHSPQEAMAMFDLITYCKGASVLRMLEQHLTEEVFRDGIRRYLAEHAFSNTTTADLWAALAAASGQPIAAIMGTWINQGGHPIVQVDAAEVTSRPFSLGPADGDSAIGEGWSVPLHARSLDGGDVRVVLTDRARLALRPPIVSNGGDGVFRSGYDPATLRALTERLGELTELERAVLVADTWARCFAGDAALGEFLSLARAASVRAEPAAWATIDRALGTLGRLVAPEQREAFFGLVTEVAGPLARRLSWEPRAGESDAVARCRPVVLRLLGGLGHDTETRAMAAARLERGEVHGDVGGAVVAIAAATAAPGTRERLGDLLGDAPDPQVEERLRSGLAAVEDLDAGLATYAECFDRFRIQDAPIVLAQLVANPVAGPAVWEAMALDFSALVARVPPQLQGFLVRGIPSLLGQGELAARVLEFHRTHPLEVGEAEAAQLRERLAHGVAFADRARPQLEALLR